MPSITNFNRFASMLSPYQRDALDAIKGALQDDPTCLDTHRSGDRPLQAAEEKKEESQ